MALINEIEKTLHENFQCKPNKSNIYELDEKSETNYPSTRLKKQGKMLVYKLDEKNPFPFFKDGCAKSICDYVIFYEKKEQFFVILGNLKSKNKSNTHGQIDAGHTFSKFIVETAKRCFSSNQDTIFVALHIMKKVFNETKIEEYKNGLRYKYHRCSSDCDLDEICY